MLSIYPQQEPLVTISLRVRKITLHKKWLHILTLPEKLCRIFFYFFYGNIFIWSQKWLKLSQKVTNFCSVCRLGNVSHMKYPHTSSWQTRPETGQTHGKIFWLFWIRVILTSSPVPTFLTILIILTIVTILTFFTILTFLAILTILTFLPILNILTILTILTILQKGASAARGTFWTMRKFGAGDNKKFKKIM